MKILFCIKALSTKGGGAERVMTDVANGLVDKGHQVSVLTYDQPGASIFYPLDPRIERVELGIGPTDQPSGFWCSLRRIAALRDRIVPMEPDVVIGFMHSMFVPLGIAMVGTGIPVIASEHIVPVHYQSRPIEALLLRLVPWFVRRITCISEQVRDSYSPALARKMIPVPNPVTVCPAGRADVIGAPGQRKRLLTVGRLEEQKDHATLIHAFAEIADRVPDWDLKIVGEGGLREDLTALITFLGLSGRVSMPGAVNAEVIADEYLAAQLFVLPSRYESFGLTTAEALVHGLPVIGFEDCQGTNLLIHPGENGTLVTAGEEREKHLAEGLLALMSDDALRQKYAENAVGSVENKHGLEVVVGAWDRLLVNEVESTDDQSRAQAETAGIKTIGGDKSGSRIVLALASIGLLAWVVYQNEMTQVFGKISEISLSTIFYCVVLLTFNQWVGGLRFLFLLRLPASVSNFIHINYANAKSLVAGLVLFNIIGQGLSRSRFLYKEGIGRDGFILTGLERVLSLFVLLVLASAGAFFSFGAITFGGEVTYLTTIGVGLGLVCLVVGWQLMRDNIVQNLGIRISSGLYSRLSYSMAISLVMHLLMACAYLLLAYEITGSLQNLQIVGAIFVVMLAASFPISFNGWGMRELSAGAAFALIGLDAESGVAMSVMIGLLSVVALGLNVTLSALSTRWARAGIDWISRSDVGETTQGLEALVLGLATCAFVGFFMRVPYGTTEVTVNLADPFAIVAGLSFAFQWSHASRFQKVWRVRGLGFGLSILLCVLLASFFIGASRFGVTDWALVNRLVGSVLLLAYVLTGVGLAAFFHDDGVRHAGAVIVTALCAVVIFEVIVRQFNVAFFAEYYRHLNTQNLVSLYDLGGFTQNRNQFVFILLTAFSFLVVLMTDVDQKKRRRYEWLAGLVVCAIYLTHSRSGIITGIALLGVVGYFRWVSVQRIALFGAIWFMGFSLIPPFLHLLKKLKLISSLIGFISPSKMTSLSSDSLLAKQLAMQRDRMYSYAEGFNMWLENPVFGGGLGAFIQEQMAQNGVPLVIHSTPLWLLAEMGLVGLLLVLSVPLVMVLHLRRQSVQAWCANDRGLLLILVVMALMSIFHEMLYQRIFWLSLGILAAHYWPRALAPNGQMAKDC